jgi:glycosyltransferase involved in cell wall biosynthesis
MGKPSSKTVSVVLATHNGAKHIEEQIRSIAAQTLAPSELIISDDASSDDTIKIVQHVVSQLGLATKTKINRNGKALGFRDNFLQTCLLARGDFIAFCDQDDVWHPTKLEKCSEFFEDKTVSLIVHAAELIDDKSNHIGMFRQGIRDTAIKSPLSYDPWATFWGFSIVFRRELLGLIDINERCIDYIVPSELIAHDRWVTFLGQMVGATAEIKEPLAGYRQHSNNLFGAGSNKQNIPAVDVHKRSEDYIKATSQMVSILSKMPSETTKIFPLFDERKCQQFLNSALLQLKSRHKIYESTTRSRAFRHVWECLSDGYYRNVHNGSIRWGSLARDIKFAVLRT